MTAKISLFSKKFLALGVALVLGLGFGFVPAGAGAATTDASIALAISPASVSVGDTFTATVTVTNPSGQTIPAARSWLAFDDAKLDFVSVAGVDFDTFAPNENQLNGTGVLRIGLGKAGGVSAASITVARATFRATAAGTASISFYDPAPAAPALPKTAVYVVENAVTTTNILATIGGAQTATIAAPVTPAAPVSSGGGGGGSRSGYTQPANLGGGSSEPLSTTQTEPETPAVGGGPVETATGETTPTETLAETVATPVQKPVTRDSLGRPVIPKTSSANLTTTPATTTEPAPAISEKTAAEPTPAPVETPAAEPADFTLTAQTLSDRLRRITVEAAPETDFAARTDRGTLDETAIRTDEIGRAGLLLFLPADGAATVTVAPTGDPAAARTLDFAPAPAPAETPAAPAVSQKIPAEPATPVASAPVQKPSVGGGPVETPATPAPAEPVAPVAKKPAPAPTAPAPVATTPAPAISQKTSAAPVAETAASRWAAVPPRNRPAEARLTDPAADSGLWLISTQKTLDREAKAFLPAGVVGYKNGVELAARPTIDAPRKIAPPAPAVDGRRYGTVWEFGPSAHEVVFDGEVTIALPVDTDALNLDPRIYYFDRETAEWVYIDNPGKIEDGRIVAPVDHFTPFTVMYLRRDPALAGLPETLVATGPGEIAVAILLVALAAGLAARRRRIDFFVKK